MKYKVSKSISTSGNSVTFHFEPIEGEHNNRTYETHTLDDLESALVFLGGCIEDAERLVG